MTLATQRRTLPFSLFLKLVPLLWALGLALGLAWSVQAAPLALARAGQPDLLPPPAEGRVADAAGLLGAEAVRRINATLADLEAKNGVEIGVATVPTTEPLDPDQYAVELFRSWGIGKKGLDNGLLILLAQKERRLKVEVGYGLEGIFPDGRVGRLLDDYAMPALKQGRYGEGLVALTGEFARIAAAEYDQAGAGGRRGGRGGWGGSTGLFGGPLVAGLLPGLIFFAFVLIVLTGAALGLARPYGHRCPRCRGRMLKESEETLRAATAEADGLSRVHYRCPRCGYERVAEIVLPMLIAGELVERRRRFRGPFGPFGGPFGGGGGFGGGSGGGGGFGGFGGGSSGGGGAGRNF